MFLNNVKQLFLFIFVGVIVISCDDDDNPMGPQHTDAEGMILELNGNEVYREFEGEILVNDLSLTINNTLELSVHFLDHDGEEIEHEEDEHAEGEEEDELTFTGYDTTIISLEVEEHCDEITDQTECESSDHCEWHTDDSMCENHDDDEEEHCDEITDQIECESSDHCEWHTDESACEDGEHGEDDHAHEEHHELGFKLTGLSTGLTSFSVSLMHDGHADYTSLLIPITVSAE